MAGLWERWYRWKRPDEAELDDAIASGRAVAAPRGAVRDLFAEIAARDLEGFERVNDNRWVAPHADGGFRVLEMRALKGYHYTLAWGVARSRTAPVDECEFGSLADVPVGTVHWRVRPEGGWWFPDEIEALWESCRPAAEAFWQCA